MTQLVKDPWLLYGSHHQAACHEAAHHDAPCQRMNGWNQQIFH
ncbi:mCG147417 [Mus musculus]|nr:mCG147417 [Mus musculus]